MYNYSQPKNLHPNDGLRQRLTISTPGQSATPTCQGGGEHDLLRLSLLTLNL